MDRMEGDMGMAEGARVAHMALVTGTDMGMDMERVAPTASRSY